MFYLSFVRIPYTQLTKSRSTCRDTIDNLRRIYNFLASNAETCALLARFRLWPLIFVPRTSDTGDFLFAYEVFWTDSENLMMNSSDTNVNDIQNIPIKRYYDNDIVLEKFFVETLIVKPEPTLDDYLLLLSSITGKPNEYIWKCIEVITRLAIKENKQKIVKGRDKCSNSRSFKRCIFI